MLGLQPLFCICENIYTTNLYFYCDRYKSRYFMLESQLLSLYICGNICRYHFTFFVVIIIIMLSYVEIIAFIILYLWEYRYYHLFYFYVWLRHYYSCYFMWQLTQFQSISTIAIINHYAPHINLLELILKGNSKLLSHFRCHQSSKRSNLRYHYRFSMNLFPLCNIHANLTFLSQIEPKTVRC